MVLILALNHHRLVRFFRILFKISIFKPNAIACLFKPLLFDFSFFSSFVRSSKLSILISSTPFNASLKF
ncbi:hypothetical protein HMPREF1397_00784 [Helicobacter pylori GAM115Ai]|nr:hypothetical protein HMPREF1397_00784 [Helicobacter pylori GAM115Ai]